MASGSATGSSMAPKVKSSRCESTRSTTMGVSNRPTTMAELRGRWARRDSICSNGISPAAKRLMGRISRELAMPTPTSRNRVDTPSVGTRIWGAPLMAA